MATPDQSPLPTSNLQDAWVAELHLFNQAVTPEMLALTLGRTGGWLSALLTAQVIDHPTFTTLERVRRAVGDLAIKRLIINTP